MSGQLVQWGIEQIKRRRHFLLYSAIGVSGATLDFLVFTLLISVGLPLHLANGISVTCGITNNFLLNAWFNFRVTDRLWRRFWSFYGVGMVGLALSAAFVEVGVSWMGSRAEIAKAASIVLVVITQYWLNRSVSFGVTGDGSSGEGS